MSEPTEGTDADGAEQPGDAGSDERGSDEHGSVERDPGELSRRRALIRFGSTGLGVFGAGIAGGYTAHQVGHRAEGYTEASSDAGTHGNTQEANDTYSNSTDGISSELPLGADAGPYGGPFSPPANLDADALDAVTYPPPPVPLTTRPLELEMTVIERGILLSSAFSVDAWTYNGSAPGPIIRATEGQEMRIRFRNNTGHNHNLHFHGRHSPAADGWEPVPPGGETLYEFIAGPAGVHPYHCHTMPIDQHIAKGLYGTFIVDHDPNGPTAGDVEPARIDPDAHEVVLALSGWDVDDDGRNEVYTWNGIGNFFAKFPIKVPVGQPVRAYVLNMVEYDPVASFHLHAQTFDVYPAGMGQAPAHSGDIITLGQMERAVVTFDLPERGRYMFHPHQHSMASRGAMGWFSAI